MELPTIENQKKLLKELYLKYLFDLEQTTEMFVRMTSLNLSVGRVEHFIKDNNKYFKYSKKKIEKLKSQRAEEELFNLVKDGNIKAIELFLKRIDEKKNNNNSDQKITLLLPPGMMDDSETDIEVDDKTEADHNKNDDNKTDTKSE